MTEEILDQPLNDDVTDRQHDGADDFLRDMKRRNAIDDLVRNQSAFLGLPERRMKTWDERTPDEKLEVLRETLRSKEMAIRELRQQIDALMGHVHGANGELLTRLYGGGMLGCAPGGIYDPLA